ncbi:MAG TPA: hypothetical protein VML75_28740 [Kofleriaceae bacterium]|nr:hypothetical protein [Kofleriaceae bacterium]
MEGSPYALDPGDFLRAIDASRDTLGRARMKLLDIVDRVRELSDDAPYAVVGGLAQILWARKTHTDDLDVALAGDALAKAYARVADAHAAATGWRLPAPPDRPHEEDDVFEVFHLLYRGAVVDLIAFKDEAFTREIVATARVVAELDGIRFVRPELLLITHLLRPTPLAKLAAVELLLARRPKMDFDLDYARGWASQLAVEPALDRIIELADRVESD